MCSIETILEATGENEASRIQDVEIIFTETNNFTFSWKESVPNLRSLTLIDTRLSSIANLGSIGSNLKTLQLTKQGLTSMENLFLPNLTELLLQENQITKIDGLSGCPKLRRLWLSRNKIQKLEGLHHVGDLRELWIQDNNLESLKGLESNVSIRNLALANNKRITSLRQVDPLALLPNLRELSFADETFGECPIVAVDGYYNNTICTLSQIRVLDNIRVNDADRIAAEDEFLNEQLIFNDRLEELHQQHESDLRDIKEKRRAAAREAEKMRSQLMHSFVKLEEVVTKGRNRIQREQEKQRLIREKNTDELREKLTRIKEEHRSVIDSLIEEERQSIQSYDMQLDALSKRATFELQETVMLAELQYHADPERRVVFQTIKGENTSPQSMSSELRSLCLLLLKAQSVRHSQPCLKAFRAAKMFSTNLYNKHQNAIIEKRIGAETESIQAFIAVKSIHDSREVMETGFLSLVGNSSLCEGLVLYTDPFVAAKSPAQISSPTPTIDGEKSDYHRLFLCRLVLERHMVLKGSCPSSQKEALEWLERAPKDCSTLKIEYSNPEDDEVRSLFIIRPESLSLIYPEIYMTLQEQKISSTSKKLNSEDMVTKEESLDKLLAEIVSGNSHLEFNSDPLSGLSQDNQNILKNLENKVDHYLKHYEDCIIHEMDPRTADTLSNAESKLLEKRKSLSEIRAQIDREKSKQEQILREFRSSSSSGGSRKKKYSI